MVCLHPGDNIHTVAPAPRDANLKRAVNVFPALIDAKSPIDGTLDPQVVASSLLIHFHDGVDLFHLCKGVNIGILHHLVEIGV